MDGWAAEPDVPGNGVEGRPAETRPHQHRGELDDLRSPPGNHLENLEGDRAGQYSIRINDQYRICFSWQDDGAVRVEVTDYHWTRQLIEQHGKNRVEWIGGTPFTPWQRIAPRKLIGTGI